MATVLHGLFDLTGRVALITGGSRGLGLQIAEALGEFGARVVLAARKPDELAAAVAQLAAAGIDAVAIPADLRSPAAAQALAEGTLAACGRIDILVNNAGATWGAAAEDHTPEQWRRVMDLNLDAPFYLSQAAARLWMIPRAPWPHPQYRLDRRAEGGDPPARDGRLQHQQGGPHPPHPRARRRVGPVRHYRERAGAGLVPLAHDPRDAGGVRRRTGRAGAAGAAWRAGRPEGCGAAVRFGRGGAHHRPGAGGGWRRLGGLMAFFSRRTYKQGQAGWVRWRLWVRSAR